MDRRWKPVDVVTGFYLADIQLFPAAKRVRRRFGELAFEAFEFDKQLSQPASL